VGRIREKNEDRFLALTFDAVSLEYLGKMGEKNMETGDCVFAVSDGMGGANAGEFASRIAVEKITRLLPRGFQSESKGFKGGHHELIQEVYHQTHRALTYLGETEMECQGMGATLSLCWFTPGWMHWGHIGDSRIYYFPASGGIRQVSSDDTHVGWLYRTGKITEWEARTHPSRNALQKALGAGHQFIDPQIGSVAYEKGDRFMICSDGLTDGLWDADLERVIQDQGLAGDNGLPAERLGRAALEKSGRDNITVVVVEVVA
jgi:protein phosphatase